MREAELFTQADQIVTDYVSRIGTQADHTVPSTPDWTVRQLVNHIAQNNLTLAKALTGQPEEIGDDVLGDGLEAGWNESAQKAEHAASAETDMQRTIDSPMGEMTVAAFLSMQLVDRLVHAWDLAHAIGADEALEPGLVQAAYDVIVPQAEQARNAGFFGPEVEVGSDASLQERLLALTGRDPGYSHVEPVSDDQRAEEIHRS